MAQLSIQQRMLASKKKRQEQLRKYLMIEKSEGKKGDRVHDGSFVSAKKKRGPRKEVTFDPNALLFEAVLRNDLNEVRQLLQSSVSDKDAVNCYGMTSLHQCCINHNLSMIHLLAKEFSADISKSDNENWTPLHTVALFGFADIAKFLLDNGADPLCINIDMNMPYDMCEDTDTLNVIEAHMAAKEVTQDKIEKIRKVGERKILKELQQQITTGRSCKYSGRNGESLLHVASANGYYEVASLLINNFKEDVSSFDHDLWQPVHAASYWQQVKVMELLLTNGADIYAKNNDGETAVDLCRDEDFSAWLISTYNNQHKKNGKSPNNIMKTLLKKSASTRHKFDSSVSINDLNKYSFSTNRLSKEVKEKNQKKDKQNEYHLMISSKDKIDEEDYDEDSNEDKITELKDNHHNPRRPSTQVRKGSHQISPPIISFPKSSEKRRESRKESLVQNTNLLTVSSGNHQESPNVSQKRKGSRKESLLPLINTNILAVPLGNHQESPNISEKRRGSRKESLFPNNPYDSSPVSERTPSWQDAVKKMDNQVRRNSSAVSKVSAMSDDLKALPIEKKLKIKNGAEKSFNKENSEQNNVSQIQEKSKRSKSVAHVEYNKEVNNLHRMSLAENSYKKKSKKRCIIS